MRSSYLLALYAVLGTLVVTPTSGGHLHFTSAGILAVLLLFAVGHAFECGRTQPPRATRDELGNWGMGVAWAVYPAFLAVAVWSLFWYQTWDPVPVLVVCLVSYALSFVLRVRENRAIAALGQNGLRAPASLGEGR